MAQKPKVRTAVTSGAPSVPTEPRLIKKSEELWSQYTLDDGTIIQIRPILVEAEKAKNKFDAEGNPIYYLKTAIVMNVKTPGKFKKKKPSRKKRTPRKTTSRKNA